MGKSESDRTVNCLDEAMKEYKRDNLGLIEYEHKRFHQDPMKGYLGDDMINEMCEGKEYIGSKINSKEESDSDEDFRREIEEEESEEEESEEEEDQV